MQRTISHKIAFLLKIVNWVLVIPTTIFSMGTALYLLIMSFSGELNLLLGVAAILLTYFFGTTLLYGYYKHSHGELSKTKACLLWIGTIVFNFVPFMLILINLTANNRSEQIEEAAKFYVYNILGAYQTAILLAVIALVEDVRRDFE